MLAVLLLAGCLAAGLHILVPGGQHAARAVVYVDGAVVNDLSLLHPLTVTQRMVRAEAVLEVQPGRIRVARSDCPQHICVERGWISRPGETIVCIPGRLLIEVKGRGPEAGYDAITN